VGEHYHQDKHFLRCFVLTGAEIAGRSKKVDFKNDYIYNTIPVNNNTEN
jgi:hypothetical protein